MSQSKLDNWFDEYNALTIESLIIDPNFLDSIEKEILSLEVEEILEIFKTNNQEIINIILDQCEECTAFLNRVLSNKKTKIFYLKYKI